MSTRPEPESGVRELTDFLKAGDAELGVPRLSGMARMRAMAGVPEPDAAGQGLSREAAEWLELAQTTTQTVASSSELRMQHLSSEEKFYAIKLQHQLPP